MVILAAENARHSLALDYPNGLARERATTVNRSGFGKEVAGRMGVLLMLTGRKDLRASQHVAIDTESELHRRARLIEREPHQSVTGQHERQWIGSGGIATRNGSQKNQQQ
jgi:hypothetical protein